MDAQPETMTASEEKNSFNWRVFILWPFLVLLLYVLSVGPVMMMVRKGRISPKSGFVNRFYQPLNWAYQKTPLHKPLGM